MVSATWTQDDEAIREMTAGDGRSSLNIGGRFTCESDEQDDPMSAALKNEGLNLCDSGQCEIVGFRQVYADETVLSPCDRRVAPACRAARLSLDLGRSRRFRSRDGHRTGERGRVHSLVAGGRRIRPRTLREAANRGGLERPCYLKFCAMPS